MVTADTLAGVPKLLDGYVRVRTDDRIVLAYTPECKQIAAAIVVELRRRSIAVETIGMFPVSDDTLLDRLAEVLPPPSEGGTGRLVLLTIERSTMSHAAVFKRATQDYHPDQLTVVRLINASDEFFELALNLLPEELSSLNAGVLHRLRDSRKIRITSSGGTDLCVGLDFTKYRWVSNRGVRRAGAFMILPAGEVSTFPATINGRLVADGAFNVTAYTELDARLKDNPLVVDVRDGRVVDFDSSHPRVKALMARCLEFEYADIVGELGFGTNLGISRFVSMNSHINERRPTVHIGFGQHGQRIDVVPYLCDVHLDLIMADAIISLDDGGPALNMSALEPSSLPHPEGTYDEDIDGDCCGIFS